LKGSERRGAENPLFQEHFPAKACPGLDPGWEPVRRRKCDKTKEIERFPIQLERKPL
jgi:hypothetical protein